jgi:hypothetical protein
MKIEPDGDQIALAADILRDEYAYIDVNQMSTAEEWADQVVRPVLEALNRAEDETNQIVRPVLEGLANES